MLHDCAHRPGPGALQEGPKSGSMTARARLGGTAAGGGGGTSMLGGASSARQPMSARGEQTRRRQVCARSRLLPVAL